MANNTTYQYEPLPVPKDWSPEEKRFAARLSDVLDDIYLKWGRIGENLLSGGLRQTIRNKADASEVQSAIEQTASQIRAEVTDARQSLGSSLSQTASELRAQVSDIQVGGVNLLPDSDFRQGTWGTAAGWTFVPSWTHLDQTFPAYQGAATDATCDLWHRGECELTGGTRYTLSFDYMKSGTADATVFVVERLADGSTDTAVRTLNPIVISENADVLQRRTYTWTTQPDCRRVTIGFRVAPGAQVTLARFKLEAGSMATDWCLCDAEFCSGSAISMTKDHVRIVTQEFSVDVPGDDGDLTLNENGMRIAQIDSPSVAAAYTGPAVIYVDASAEASGNTVNTLGAALAMISDRLLRYDVAIALRSDTRETELMRLWGTFGSGRVTVVMAGHTAYGDLSIQNLGVWLEISGGSICGSNSGDAISISNARCVYFQSMTLNSAADVLLRLTKGAVCRVADCALYNAACTFAVDSMAQLFVSQCSGSGTYWLKAEYQAIVDAYGTLPEGEAQVRFGAQLRETDTSRTSGTQSAPVSVSTMRIPCTATRTWRSSGSWRSETSAFWQGYTTGNRTMRGILYFDMSALQGKTITNAALTLRRVSGVGKGSAVDVRAYPCNSASPEGTPQLNLEAGALLGSIRCGATASFSLPLSMVQAMVDGTWPSIGLYVAESTPRSGKVYSENYARYYGFGEADAPVITVSCQ
ncbi:MAG: hypothetical protein Q4E13_00330 [Clostridia bacterium]|nr:hypothetical protein [Clostridia bacterium]